MISIDLSFIVIYMIQSLLDRASRRIEQFTYHGDDTSPRARFGWGEPINRLLHLVKRGTREGSMEASTNKRCCELSSQVELRSGRRGSFVGEWRYLSVVDGTTTDTTTYITRIFQRDPEVVCWGRNAHYSHWSSCRHISLAFDLCNSLATLSSVFQSNRGFHRYLALWFTQNINIAPSPKYCFSLQINICFLSRSSVLVS